MPGFANGASAVANHSAALFGIGGGDGDARSDNDADGNSADDSVC